MRDSVILRRATFGGEILTTFFGLEMMTRARNSLVSCKIRWENILYYSQILSFSEEKRRGFLRLPPQPTFVLFPGGCARDSLLFQCGIISEFSSFFI